MSACVETPIVFGDRLVGVVTKPVPGVAVRTTGVVLHNAGLIDHAGAHRTNVEAARDFAARGFSSLRFDLSGIGDSAPRRDRTPFAVSMVEETRLALDALEEHTGVERFALMGLCSGADQAFQTTVADSRVRGGVWIDGYPYLTTGYRVHRVLRPLRRAATWRKLLRGGVRIAGKVRAAAAVPEGDAGMEVRDIPPREEALAGIRAALDRGVALCVVFTAGQLGSYNHAGQFYEMYPELRGAAGIDYRYFADADHTFTQRAARRDLIDHVGAWLERTFGDASE